MTIETTEAKIGRSMKKWEMRIAAIAYLLACGASLGAAAGGRRAAAAPSLLRR